jgi:hypothetical protein
MAVKDDNQVRRLIHDFFDSREPYSKEDVQTVVGSFENSLGFSISDLLPTKYQ